MPGKVPAAHRWENLSQRRLVLLRFRSIGEQIVILTDIRDGQLVRAEPTGGRPRYG